MQAGCVLVFKESQVKDLIQDIPDDKPVLIAGCTASGKNDLALHLASRRKSAIINADALQVYKEWEILTARPDPSELAQADHFLYGHIPVGSDYSVGHWLRETSELLPQLQAQGYQPIIIGGTGLYFKALTEGLAEIPQIPNEVKQAADELQAEYGDHYFGRALRSLSDPATARIDMNNPARTRRAWEVFKATNRSIATWFDNTPRPLLPTEASYNLVLEREVGQLNERIDLRFDLMMQRGALEECRAVLSKGLWDPAHPSCKAIGAKELIDVIQSGLETSIAIEDAKAQTRQFAKRQRTWFRNQMSDWKRLSI